MSWTAVGCELESILDGKRITGAENIDPDGVLLYLMDYEGNISLLEIGYDCLTESFGMYHAKLEGSDIDGT